MEKKELTNRQNQIYEFLKSEIKAKGYPPAVREIGKAVGLSSTSSVHMQLNKLEEKGYIRRDSSKTRAIEIVDDDFNMLRKDLVSVPILGRVAAGEPLLALNEVNDYYPLPGEYMPSSDSFIVTVKGESMINVGIFDKDMLIIRKQNVAENGDIIVALIDNSATVKRFYKEDGHIRLQPENDSMEPIIVPHCTILGKVCGLLRFNF